MAELEERVFCTKRDCLIADFWHSMSLGSCRPLTFGQCQPDVFIPNIVHGQSMGMYAPMCHQYQNTEEASVAPTQILFYITTVFCTRQRTWSYFWTAYNDKPKLHQKIRTRAVLAFQKAFLVIHQTMFRLWGTVKVKFNVKELRHNSTLTLLMKEDGFWYIFNLPCNVAGTYTLWKKYF